MKKSDLKQINILTPNDKINIVRLVKLKGFGNDIFLGLYGEIISAAFSKNLLKSLFIEMTDNKFKKPNLIKRFIFKLKNWKKLK